MDENIQLLIEAILTLKDPEKSASQIKADLPKVQNALNNDEKTRLKLAAGLDIAKTKKLIQAQLATIANQAKAPIIKVGVEVGKQNATQSVVQELKNVQTQVQQTASAVNQSITNLVDEFVKPIAPVFNKEGLIDAGKTIEKLQQRFQELGQVSVKGTYSDIDAVDSLDKMLVKIKALNGETRTLKFELDKLGKAFHLISGTSDNSGIFKLVQDIKNAIADYEQKIAQFKSTNHELLSGLEQPINDFNSKLEGLKNGTSTIDEVKNSFQSLNAEAAKITANFSRQLSPTDAAIRNINKGGETIRNLRSEISELSNAPVGINKELNKCVELLSNVKSIEAEQGTTENWAQAYKDWKKSVEELTSKIKALKSYESDINSSLSRLNKIQNNVTFKNNASNPSVIKAKAEIDSLVDKYRNLQTQLQGEITPEGLKSIEVELETLNSQFNSASGSATSLQRSLADTNGADKLTQRIKILTSRIEVYKNTNTKAMKNFGGVFDEMLAKLKSGNLDKIGVDELEKEFRHLQEEIKRTGQAGKTLIQSLQANVQKFAGWMSVTQTVSKFVGEIRKAVVELREVDTLLTEISKANDKLSNSQLAKIGSDSFGIASKYGKKATDYLSGVQEMSRAGYENAEAMGELSTSAQGAGDMTADVANKFIIATDKAYHFNGSVEKLTKTLDGINYITNHNAVNMSELSEGYSIVASTAAAFDVEARELAAALGTMSAVTQQSGSEIARAYKAILLNIKQVSDEEEGIDAEGLTKYEKACNALGVSLKEVVNGTLQTRDAMEVLEELSNAYVTLDENDLRRTNLLNSVGGKLRSTQLDALLRNFDTYKQMLQQFEDGTGSMAREGEKTAKSWQGKLNTLSNTVSDLTQNFINSDTAKFILDTINGIISGLNIITEKIGAIPSILSGIAIGRAFKNIGRPKMFGLVLICR